MKRSWKNREEEYHDIDEGELRLLMILTMGEDTDYED